MAADDLDLVVHVGDYIYESSRAGDKVRDHVAAEPYTLAEYRNRYALYKTDPGLQAAHAAFAWMVTWDDHEVDNDYANDRSQDLDPPEEFLQRRAAAYQAYYEHMPLPAWARPRGAHAQVYTHAAFGQLMQIHLLDGRQYRSHQACPRPGRGGSNIVNNSECPERLDPNRTMLGAEQERWLDDALSKSTARWNVIAQQTLMAQSDRDPLWGQRFWTDGWDGYPRARERLLASIAGRKIANPLVLGGDVHTAFVTDLKTDFNDNRSPVVATEMLGPSITSRGPSMRLLEAVRHKNPHFKWANSTDRGYASFELMPERCITRMRGVASVNSPDARMRELAAFVVENGKAGAQPV
jgi:alkaline phosphatase D